jgi:hypothetical protein
MTAPERSYPGGDTPEIWLSAFRDGDTIEWQKVLPDPFVHHRMVIVWSRRDLLRLLFTRKSRRTTEARVVIEGSRASLRRWFGTPAASDAARYDVAKLEQLADRLIALDEPFDAESVVWDRRTISLTQLIAAAKEARR